MGKIQDGQDHLPWCRYRTCNGSSTWEPHVTTPNSADQTKCRPYSKLPVSPRTCDHAHRRHGSSAASELATIPSPGAQSRSCRDDADTSVKVVGGLTNISNQQEVIRLEAASDKAESSITMGATDPTKHRFTNTLYTKTALQRITTKSATAIEPRLRNIAFSQSLHRVHG